MHDSILAGVLVDRKVVNSVGVAFAHRLPPLVVDILVDPKRVGHVRDVPVLVRNEPNLIARPVAHAIPRWWVSTDCWLRRSYKVHHVTWSFGDVRVQRTAWAAVGYQNHAAGPVIRGRHVLACNGFCWRVTWLKRCGQYQAGGPPRLPAV